MYTDVMELKYSTLTYWLFKLKASGKQQVQNDHLDLCAVFKRKKTKSPHERRPPILCKSNIIIFKDEKLKLREYYTHFIRITLIFTASLQNLVASLQLATPCPIRSMSNCL